MGTMSYSGTTGEWRLMQERCDHCRLSPKHIPCSCRCKNELLCMRHTSHNIGGGVNHCMDVCVPSADGCDAVSLSTRLPAWNDELNSLVLDFTDRQILPSAKNFQLVLDDDPDHVVCQYGKI